MVSGCPILFCYPPTGAEAYPYMQDLRELEQRIGRGQVPEWLQRSV